MRGKKLEKIKEGKQDLKVIRAPIQVDDTFVRRLFEKYPDTYNLYRYKRVAYDKDNDTHCLEDEPLTNEEMETMRDFEKEVGQVLGREDFLMDYCYINNNERVSITYEDRQDVELEVI